jgi:uncharacterized metal-binding protein
MMKKMAVVSCSGIGKSLGSVAREAAYILTEDLCPEKTKIVALALLVLADEKTRQELKGCQTIAIDGCKLECAARGLEASGAEKIFKIAVFDILRNHRGLKPEGVTELNNDGRRLARKAAQAASEIIHKTEEEGNA